MNIGIDYGGVMDNDPDTWCEIIKDLIKCNHTVYIISHAHPGLDENKREVLANQTGAINLSFSDTMDEEIIKERKANFAIKYKIDLFVDDYFSRCEAVYRKNPTCNFICVHYSKQHITQNLIKGLIR